MKFIRQNIFRIQFRLTGARVPNPIPVKISNEDICVYISRDGSCEILAVLTHDTNHEGIDQ